MEESVEKKVTEDGHVVEKKKIIKKYNSFQVPVDAEEVERVLKLVRESFKRTPPKLNHSNGDYDVFNKLLAETSFEHCYDGVDIARTLYEAMLPLFRTLHDSKVSAIEESELWVTPMTDLYTYLREVGIAEKGKSPMQEVNKFINELRSGVKYVTNKSSAV